jgi:hypothetical protein
LPNSSNERSDSWSRRRQYRADVGLRFAGGEPVLDRHAAQRIGQIMAQLLAQAGQVAIVQHEPHIVLHHSQTLAGSVCSGIQDAECPYRA